MLNVLEPMRREPKRLATQSSRSEKKRRYVAQQGVAMWLSAAQGKWNVPLPKVRAMGEDEVMKVLASGKRRRKAWKRVITKHTFVGETFTRKPPKFERFIRPMALRSKKAHVTHPEVTAPSPAPLH